ncbi:hypothetical protein IHE44_0007368 [Lamprotornis superbus]|uniref:Dehydrogenase/reductase SDR family member 11 n=1 Tax=Lamprotornis superbus TaxID=245042 RepID=A0A835NZE4_9PASS|nr:hypothetical protein IHE44_0007368 [Lamprotornis superbus]
MAALALCFMVRECWRDCTLMLVEVIGLSLTKPGHSGKCWSKEQEPGMLWILKDWVNVMAVSICTREAYQSMKERNIDDGHIININSMNGHSVVPQSVVHFYSATKYAVTALTEGLRQELREARTHIRATVSAQGPAGASCHGPQLFPMGKKCKNSAQHAGNGQEMLWEMCISPGLVETGFAFKLHDNDPERAAATYESIRCLKAEDMANAVIYVLSAPPHVQVCLILVADAVCGPRTSVSL